MKAAATRPGWSLWALTTTVVAMASATLDLYVSKPTVASTVLVWVAIFLTVTELYTLGALLRPKRTAPPHTRCFAREHDLRSLRPLIYLQITKSGAIVLVGFNLTHTSAMFGFEAMVFGLSTLMISAIRLRLTSLGVVRVGNNIPLWLRCIALLGFAAGTSVVIYPFLGHVDIVHDVVELRVAALLAGFSLAAAYGLNLMQQMPPSYYLLRDLKRRILLGENSVGEASGEYQALAYGPDLFDVLWPLCKNVLILLEQKRQFWFNVRERLNKFEDISADSDLSEVQTEEINSTLVEYLKQMPQLAEIESNLKQAMGLVHAKFAPLQVGLSDEDMGTLKPYSDVIHGLTCAIEAEKEHCKRLFFHSCMLVGADIPLPICSEEPLTGATA